MEDSKRQTAQQCAAVTSNFDRIGTECEKNTTGCITESSGTGIGTVPAIQQLICPPTKSIRENIYDVLVGCTSQRNADEIYAGLCGSTTADDGTDLACTDAIVRVNDGFAAKEACCDGTDSGDPDFGPGSRCAGELRRLANDLGCCTATVVLQFFFRRRAVNGTTGLDALLQANGVERPELCDYPLYMGVSGEGSTTASTTEPSYPGSHDATATAGETCVPAILPTTILLAIANSVVGFYF